MSTDVDVDPYELLGIRIEATEQEVRTAYRQRSLKVHPDRNPNNPDAARKFHELNQAYELLLDPLRRLALDAKLRIKQARAERFKTYDNKRKVMLEELEAAERANKKARLDKQKEEVARWQQNEKIKEEGRRMREAKEQQLRQMEEKNKAASQEEEMDAPTLDPLDTTVHLKYTLKSHPSLTTPAAIAQLLAQFGEVDVESIVLSLKAPKKDPTKPPKFGSALVPFKQIGNAFAAVSESGKANRGLDKVEIGWVGGKEPPILAWLRRMGKLGGAASAPSPSTTSLPTTGGTLPAHQPANSSTFSSFPASQPVAAEISPPGLDYESLTLMRLRQAERERLEREIREQDAKEEA